MSYLRRQRENPRPRRRGPSQRLRQRQPGIGVGVGLGPPETALRLLQPALRVPRRAVVCQRRPLRRVLRAAVHRIPFHHRHAIVGIVLERDLLVLRVLLPSQPSGGVIAESPRPALRQRLRNELLIRVVAPGPHLRRRPARHPHFGQLIEPVVRVARLPGPSSRIRLQHLHKISRRIERVGLPLARRIGHLHRIAHVLVSRELPRRSVHPRCPAEHVPRVRRPHRRPARSVWSRNPPQLPRRRARTRRIFAFHKRHHSPRRGSMSYLDGSSESIGGGARILAVHGRRCHPPVGRVCVAYRGPGPGLTPERRCVCPRKGWFLNAQQPGFTPRIQSSQARKQSNHIQAVQTEDPDAADTLTEEHLQEYLFCKCPCKAHYQGHAQD